MIVNFDPMEVAAAAAVVVVVVVPILLPTKMTNERRGIDTIKQNSTLLSAKDIRTVIRFVNTIGQND